MTCRTTKILEKFEERLTFKGYARATIGTYSYFLGMFLDFTDKPLTHIFKKDAYTFIDECSQMEYSQKNHVLSSLKLFYKFILNTELNQVKTERPRRRKKLPRVISWHTLEARFKRIANLKHRVILELACRCALRVSEVCSLRLEDVDTERGMVLVRDSKGNKDRYVPVSEELMFMLFAYTEEFDPNEYLFNGQWGKRYSPSSCQKIFKKYVDSTKSFHTCRHSGATRMLDMGANLRTIQSILGHASSRTTEIYTHVSDELLAKAAI